jgi:hypothetical protein
MITEITIVDRGRGEQLSTCRITVLDLVPYFQKRLRLRGDHALDSHIVAQGNLPSSNVTTWTTKRNLTRKTVGHRKGAKSKFACNT